MIKKDILDLINKFEMETWKYDDNDKLDYDMQYIYSIEKEIKNVDESKLRPIYDKLIALIGVIRFKYGFESIIIKSNPNLFNLKEILDSFSFENSGIVSQYNYFLTIYNNFIINNRDMSFIKNKYEGIQGKEGLYLAVESMKSLISTDKYRQLLSDKEIKEIIVDCVKLNNGVVDIRVVESKYGAIIKHIWKESLSNNIDDNSKFRLLFSNISGGNLSEQADLLINRPNQSSCSMISSNFIATYGSKSRRIGFIYPSDSEILMASAYGIGSNVFGTGFKNREKGTILATPEVIEKIGMERAKTKNEDMYSSSCYSELLVNSKPCGILVIGLGEKDINIDYHDAIVLSKKMNLPIYYIDTMQYKTELSENDKYYISFHSIMSYLGISTGDLIQQNDIYEIIDTYKDQISNIFLTLKMQGKLNKENMYQMISQIIDFSKISSNSK